MSIGTDQGEVLIPTIVNGRRVSEEQAIAHYQRTGQHLGVFRTPEEATSFAEGLSRRQGVSVRGRGGFPTSFNDPLYADLARQTEAQYQLPTGILDAIRTRGERSNHGQTNQHRTFGVYQFIPSTREGMIRNHGVDPHASPEAMTQAAAIHLMESYRRTGSWDRAILEYHGGPDPRRWGPRTRRYLQNVGSFDGR